VDLGHLVADERVHLRGDTRRQGSRSIKGEQ
jgi:hypothetical protein